MNFSPSADEEVKRNYRMDDSKATRPPSSDEIDDQPREEAKEEEYDYFLE